MTESLNYTDLIKIRDFLKEKSITDPYIVGFSPFYWYSAWSNQKVGYYKLFKKLSLDYKFHLFVKSVLRLYIHIFIFKIRKININLNHLKGKDYIIFTTKNINKIDEKILTDEYFGQFSGIEQRKICFIYSFMGLLNNSDIKNLKEKNICAIYTDINPYNILLIIKNFVLDVLRFDLKIKTYLHALTGDWTNASNITRNIDKILYSSESYPKAVIFPYEANPTHHRIIEMLSKYNIQTIGYVHSAINSFPSYIINRKFSPDMLLTHSSINKKILEKFCGWNKRIKVIESTRFRKMSNSFLNSIYLPYSLPDYDFLKSEIIFILKKIRISSLSVRLHPRFINSKYHTDYSNSLKNLITKYLSTEDSCSNICVFVGITGAICEALESSNSRIITICQNIQTEFYNTKIWSNIKTIKISEFSHELIINEKGSLIKYPLKSNTNIIKQIT